MGSGDRQPNGRDGRARTGPFTVCVLLAMLLVAPACRRFTKEGADQEVYGLLDAGRRRVPEVRGTLDIEAKERLAAAIRRRETFELTLRDALALATVSSRDYRRRREDVYVAALALTTQLNRFRPLWDASGSADVRFDENGSSFDGDIDLTLSKAFENGGSVVIALAQNFLREISGDPLRTAQSILSADFVFPLLRGAGALVAREALVQAERDVLYALRDYAFFQQAFTVDIASRFYRSLQQRDNWRNAQARYESLTLLVEQQRLEAEDRRPPVEVDQVEQDLLESDDARQRARNSFERSVDQLKLDIGIPVGVGVELDDADLEALRTAGPVAAPYDRRQGLALAQRKRLDLRNESDRDLDARRRVRVARNALLPGLDIRAGANVSTPDEEPFNLGDAEATGNLGLDVDLPLERTTERNAYRRALIDAGRAKRNRERLEDSVVFDVRDAYRNLAEARRSYEIQVVSARLAERRVESTQMHLARGTALTRDRLEAEDARVRARDAVTAALVDHALALLALERDVGTLRVDAEGMWTRSAPEAGAAQRGGEIPSSSPTPPTPPRAAAKPAPAAPRANPDGTLPPPTIVPRRSGTVGK